MASELSLDNGKGKAAPKAVKVSAPKYLYAKRVPNGKTSDKGNDLSDTSYHAEFETYDTAKRKGLKRGIGPEITVKKAPAALGNGKYLNMDVATDAEIRELKTKINVKRLLEPRWKTCISGIRGLRNAFANSMVEAEEDVVEYAIAKVREELAEMERVARNEMSAAEKEKLSLL